MKRRIFQLFILPTALILLLFLPHIFFFDNHYVDLEPLYVQAALEIADHGYDADLSNYFSTIANPIFTVLVLSGSYKLFCESPVISRLTIFLLSLVFSLFLYFYVRNKEGVFISFVSALLVVVNPMFIVYSQYVHTDVPFMVFSSISLLLLLFTHSSKGEITSSIMLGISLATKYVAVVLLPVVFIYSFVKSKILKHFSKARLFSLAWFNIWYFTLSLLVSVPIILIVFYFQSTIVPSKLESVFALNAGMFIPRLFAYLLWLGLFVGPSCVIFLLDLWKKTGKTKFFMLFAALAVLTLIVSFSFPISSLHRQAFDFGEMNLGWVESAVPSLCLSLAFFFVLLIAELFIANIILDLTYSKDEKTRGLFFWIVLPILLMSFTRAANRYMLVVLVPLSLYMAFVTKRMYSERTKLFVPAILVLHALIFLSVGFYSNYYLHQRGMAR